MKCTLRHQEFCWRTEQVSVVVFRVRHTMNFKNAGKRSFHVCSLAKNTVRQPVDSSKQAGCHTTTHTVVATPRRSETRHDTYCWALSLADWHHMSQSKHSVLFALIIATFQATARVRTHNSVLFHTCYHLTPPSWLLLRGCVFAATRRCRYKKMHLYYCKEVSIKEMGYLVLIQEGVNAYHVV